MDWTLLSPANNILAIDPHVSQSNHAGYSTFMEQIILDLKAELEVIKDRFFEDRIEKERQRMEIENLKQATHNDLLQTREKLKKYEDAVSDLVFELKKVSTYIEKSESVSNNNLKAGLEDQASKIESDFHSHFQKLSESNSKALDFYKETSARESMEQRKILETLKCELQTAKVERQQIVSVIYLMTESLKGLQREQVHVRHSNQ